MNRTLLAAGFVLFTATATFAGDEGGDGNDRTPFPAGQASVSASEIEASTSSRGNSIILPLILLALIAAAAAN